MKRDAFTMSLEEGRCCIQCGECKPLTDFRQRRPPDKRRGLRCERCTSENTLARANPGLIAHSRLLAILSYDPLSGQFTWRVTLGRTSPAGALAGCISSKGYVLIETGGHCYVASRLAWFYVHGIWPSDLVDHIDGDRQNNRIANLREADAKTNAENRSCLSTNKVGLLGVSQDKSSGRFNSIIHSGGVQTRLGQFDTAEEAHAAYLEAKRFLHAGATQRAFAAGGEP